MRTETNERQKIVQPLRNRRILSSLCERTQPISLGAEAGASSGGATPVVSVRPRAAALWSTFLLALALPFPAQAKVACPGFDSLPVAEDDAGTDVRMADPANDLMTVIENNFRRGTRIVRMNIRTGYRSRGKFDRQPAQEPNPKTLWGVFQGDAERTDLLYVFSGPGRLAGTTLLMHDYVDPARPDSMWLYLRSFEIFKKIEPGTQEILVPGTALSYEDSRGFIPLDKFRFSTPPQAQRAGESANPAGVRILACPRSESIAKNLGYSSLLLRVDREKQLVVQVEYADFSGRPLKLYRLLKHTALGDRNFPSEVELEHFAEGFRTTIQYEYWLPERPPEAGFFVPDPSAGKFVDRLKGYVTEAGLGNRIETELNQSDLQLREFVDRLSKMKGGKAATSGILQPKLQPKKAQRPEEGAGPDKEL